MSLDRAREALEAAEICLERSLYHSSTSRAYYAMFWAAQAALADVGLSRSEWSHPALQASFANELIRRRKIYPAVFGQHLTEHSRRLDADYRPKGVSKRQATQVVLWAQELLAAIMK